MVFGFCTDALVGFPIKASAPLLLVDVVHDGKDGVQRWRLFLSCDFSLPWTMQ